MSISTCKLDSETKQQLDFAGNCMKIRKKEPNAFYSQQYIINRLIEEYLDKIKVKPMDKDTKEYEIKASERFLQSKRIDINLKKITKEDLRALAKALLKRKIVDRKMNYDDIVVLLLNKYLELYPELGNDLLEFRHIQGQIGQKEYEDRIQKEKYKGLI